MIFLRGKDITWAIGRVGPLEGSKSKLFWAHTALASLELFQGPRNVFAPHQNHNGPRHISCRFINSYNHPGRVALLLYLL